MKWCLHVAIGYKKSLKPAHYSESPLMMCQVHREAYQKFDIKLKSINFAMKCVEAKWHRPSGDSFISWLHHIFLGSAIFLHRNLFSPLHFLYRSFAQPINSKRVKRVRKKDKDEVLLTAAFSLSRKWNKSEHRPGNCLNSAQLSGESKTSVGHWDSY